MKQFFIILFGGLLAVGSGVGIGAASVYSWKYIRPYVVIDGHLSLSAVAKSISHSEDGTTISGLSRTVRYSAVEEEDIINAVADSLPNSPDSKVTAGSYILKNITRGDVPIEYNSDRIMPIASITKLVTAVIARKSLDQDRKITISRTVMSTYGNTANFKIGERLNVSDLMYPLLMVSSNDAAEAIAETYGRKDFVQEMNDFVQSIGAYRTYFMDPSGLSKDNVSTANDLAIILDWIMDNDPEIIAITSLKSKTIRGHTWTNPTHFLSWSYYIGGKNGYTPEANRTSAALFKAGENNNTYAVIVLDSDARDADTLKLLSKAK